MSVIIKSTTPAALRMGNVFFGVAILKCKNKTIEINVSNHLTPGTNYEFRTAYKCKAGFINMADSYTTPENIITIALDLMQVVETYQELKGVEKKQLIINTLKKFIDDEMKGTDPEYNKLILLIVNTTLPIAIDAFISIDTKQIQIKITGYLKTCCF